MRVLEHNNSSLVIRLRRSSHSFYITGPGSLVLTARAGKAIRESLDASQQAVENLLRRAQVQSLLPAKNLVDRRRQNKDKRRKAHIYDKNIIKRHFPVTYQGGEKTVQISWPRLCETAAHTCFSNRLSSGGAIFSYASTVSTTTITLPRGEWQPRTAKGNA